MAKKSHPRRRGRKPSSTSSNIKQSLHDAQTVFARYFESGGKRVKETFDALAEIFQSKHLGDALRVAPVRTGRATSSAAGRRAAAARTRTTKRASKRTARK
ncbi:hypothetical protein RA307_18980 [Xanthobacteraceae bacterium Astr-EGSB]|uniref:hypothetical protein n=1 Tax=Astrobacterium formosum TaxID=3069710 RepID=UPI0027B23CA1|nr:hypothetical protein [Xanthobacteraceae bacterium Astr-EGSB]